MDAKLLFWSGALLNMTVIAGLAVHGVRCARRGEIRRHARSMRAAALLVGLFLVSYVLKLAFLGREDLERWSPTAVWLLRFHELCVLAMLLAGGGALWLSRRLRRSRLFTREAADPAPPAHVVRRHRLAGRTALAGALLGAATAALVLLGMYERSASVAASALASAHTAALESD
jgi:uncharacterized membrane protein YozB (DUF420 family)